MELFRDCWLRASLSPVPSSHLFCGFEFVAENKNRVFSCMEYYRSYESKCLVFLLLFQDRVRFDTEICRRGTSLADAGTRLQRGFNRWSGVSVPKFKAHPCELKFGVKGADADIDRQLINAFYYFGSTFTYEHLLQL